MKNLPATTLKVYEFIARHIRQFGYGPTLRETADACFMRHSSVLRHIDRLEGMRWIDRMPSKARSIRLGDHAPDLETLWTVDHVAEPGSDEAEHTADEAE
jgi:SOS-response transcriptional repressor LexA